MRARLGKKAQTDVAIVIGAIIIPTAALIGSLLFAWLLLSPMTDLCKIAETVSYDIITLADVAYSVPDTITVSYKGPATCGFYADCIRPLNITMVKQNTLEPSGLSAFPTSDRNWYIGAVAGCDCGASCTSRTDAVCNEVINFSCTNFTNSVCVNTTCTPFTLAADNPDNNFDWFAVDIGNDGTYEIRGKHKGGTFNVGHTTYAISSMSAKRNLSTLFRETDLPIKRDLFACMGFNLVMPSFSIEKISYDTILKKGGTYFNGPFPFFSRSATPAELYDHVAERWVSMPFSYRSYANPSDFGSSVELRINNAIQIKKTRSAYYDTLSSDSIATSKYDAVTHIAKLALDTCSAEADLTTTIVLPPQYKLGCSSSLMRLDWASLPANTLQGVSSFAFSSITWNKCSYSYTGPESFYDDANPLTIELNTTYDTATKAVVINGRLT